MCKENLRLVSLARSVKGRACTVPIFAKQNQQAPKTKPPYRVVLFLELVAGFEPATDSCW